MQRKITAAALFTFFSAFAMGQVNDFTKLPDPKIFKEVNALGWIKFQDNITSSALSVFTISPKAFGLGNGYSMQLTKQHRDDIGFVHYRFQEYYDNLPITGAEFILHEKNNRLYTGNGTIYTPALISNNKKITEAAALNYALNSINAKKGYYWQDPLREAAIKKRTASNTATYYPNASMAYILSDDNTKLLLCYRFLVQSLDFGRSCYCFVNAGNGKVEKQYAVEYACDPTSFSSSFYGTQTLYTNDVGVFTNSYDLEDNCTSSVYGVYDATNSNNIFNTGNNIWASDWQRSAATSLWTIKASYYWYKSFFGRNGHDNDDGDIDIYQGVNFGTAANPNNNNASYHYDALGDDEINVGIGDNALMTNDWNTLDILAHEFTHGVTNYEANLVYEKEPGALNESFSDLFAEWIENKVFGNNDWYMGTDRLAPNGCPAPVRNMKNPADTNASIGGCSPYKFYQPNTYGGTNWVPVNGCTPVGPNLPGENDECGVHTNSGVQNQMFYFLCTGGSGFNDGLNSHSPNGTGYQWTVAGIGIDKAIRIAYRVLNDYLNSQSGYADARYAWVAAATDLYGECSFEAIQTGKAWYAAGIGPPVAGGYAVCGSYGNVAYYLTKPGIINVATSCVVNILPTNNQVRFAGTRVVLNPGFSALNGSLFTATTDTDCAFAAY